MPPALPAPVHLPKLYQLPGVARTAPYPPTPCSPAQALPAPRRSQGCSLPSQPLLTCLGSTGSQGLPGLTLALPPPARLHKPNLFPIAPGLAPCPPAPAHLHKLLLLPGTAGSSPALPVCAHLPKIYSSQVVPGLPPALPAPAHLHKLYQFRGASGSAPLPSQPLLTCTSSMCSQQL